MNEGAALRVLSFLNDTSQRHLETLASEKRKVTVIGEEHEPDEFQEEEASSSFVNNIEAPLLTPEQIKEFYKAVEEGSIERLEELFDSITNVDPNMTNYTESLLMAAIRAKRRKVAEYLIDQLGVNVNHTTDLIEFRINTRIPIRERTISCRDLAYEKGMMDLVDLIDIASDEVKPSIKRYLKRRLKARLDEIHQAYVKRMADRTHRLTIQTQEKENQLLEEEEEELEKENEEASITNTADDTILPPPPPPPPPVASSIPPLIHRSYKSHIEETVQKLESKNEKSIDETGKKSFRFSNYTIRYRLVEGANTNLQTQSKPTLFSFPLIPSTTTQSLSRPVTTATLVNTHRRSFSEINSVIPVRETRTSICRSARRIATPRVTSSVNIGSKSEIKLAEPLPIPKTQRLLPKRTQAIRRNYGYIPQFQQELYNEPRRSMPVTLKATAIGLPSDTRLIRD